MIMEVVSYAFALAILRLCHVKEYGRSISYTPIVNQILRKVNNDEWTPLLALQIFEQLFSNNPIEPLNRGEEITSNLSEHSKRVDPIFLV